jgi:heme/copper-type cytochrome/quinol oxidase subunit 2
LFGANIAIWLASTDHDFARFPRLKWINPLLDESKELSEVTRSILMTVLGITAIVLLVIAALALVVSGRFARSKKARRGTHHKAQRFGTNQQET